MAIYEDRMTVIDIYRNQNDTYNIRVSIHDSEYHDTPKIFLSLFHDNSLSLESLREIAQNLMKYCNEAETERR